MKIYLQMGEYWILLENFLNGFDHIDSLASSTNTNGQAHVTWLSVASALRGALSDCCSLNDLIGKHAKRVTKIDTATD